MSLKIFSLRNLPENTTKDSEGYEKHYFLLFLTSLNLCHKKAPKENIGQLIKAFIVISIC